MSNRQSIACLFATLLIVASCPAEDVVTPRRVVSIETPRDASLAPLAYLATLGDGPGAECSGIVASRRHADLYWTLNDSGNEPRVFPVHRNGEVYVDGAGTASAGVTIQGATNVDWEDIAVDAEGHLIVCDVGNNSNERRNLTLYYVDEPNPNSEAAAVARRLRVRYPDQHDFPAPRNNFNFDCEGVFTVENTVYLFTKHRSDLLTNLYRLDDPDPDAMNILTYVGTFDSRGAVTAADASDDGLRIVFITYSSIWLFERDDLETPLFDSRVSWSPFLAVQMESVCFTDDDTLLLVDEKLGMVFELPLSELTQVRQ